MNKLALHWQILIGMGLGLVVGIALNLSGDTLTANLDPDGLIAGAVGFVVKLNSFIGQLFIRTLRFIAVPIVLFSLIAGVSNVRDLRKLSRVGGKTIGIYLTTTAIAITLGLVLVNLFQPGASVDEEVRNALGAEYAAEASAKIQRAQSPDVWQTVLNIVPENPFEALAEAKMLQVVFLALMIGILLTVIPTDKSAGVIRLADAMSDVFIAFVNFIMALAPYAVFALIADVISKLGFDVLVALLAYSMVVVAGLLTLILGVYPLVLRLFTRVGYRFFFRGIARALLLAFSSSSSSATLPVTLKVAQERLGISEEVASFVLPVGATINMDGTALYQGVAAVFIAQLYGMDLTLAQQLTIVLTATLASIGTAGVPGVGMIMLVIVLESVGIPLEGIAVILGVDRLLDMCRTCANVTGDCMVSCVVASTEGEIELPAAA